VTVGPGDSGGPAFLWVDANGNGEIDSVELIQFGVNAFGLGGGSIPESPLFGSQAGGMLVSGYQDFLVSIH